jgi:hypothetical protein
MTSCGRIEAIEALLAQACARTWDDADSVGEEAGSAVVRAHSQLLAQLLDPVDRLILEVATLVMLPASTSASVLAGHRQSARRLLCILDAEPSEIDRVLSLDDAQKLRARLVCWADPADRPSSG